jgi:fluoride exporter
MIATGGAIGAGCRWLVIDLAGVDDFPWPVLLVNVVGSFVLGILLAEEARTPRSRTTVRDLGVIGFCGGLTTFSTFAVEVVELLDDGKAGVVALYITASLAGTMLAVVLGGSLLRTLRPPASRLEEPA